MVVDQRGEITSAQDYYPFGETLRTYTVGSGQNDKYKFTEKERDIETGYDYFGARFYDSSIGRWLSVDPLASKYPGWSPYNYTMNNPLRYIDPNGMYSAETADGSYNDGDDDKKKKIAIDPGHGDHNNKNSQVDPGAVNGEDYEKDLVLPIVKSLYSTLEAAGYDIILTRSGDVKNAGKKISWRLKKAKGSDILVSIHLNSNLDSKPNGYQVLYNNSASKILAQYIQNSNTLLKSNGIKQRTDLGILKYKGGASVLIEAGFISNNVDLDIIKNNSSEMGKEIGSGIINYLNRKEW